MQNDASWNYSKKRRKGMKESSVGSEFKDDTFDTLL
jgi:hypothetical protein